jgi:hypothetical protein
MPVDGNGRDLVIYAGAVLLRKCVGTSQGGPRADQPILGDCSPQCARVQAAQNGGYRTYDLANVVTVRERWCRR